MRQDDPAGRGGQVSSQGNRVATAGAAIHTDRSLVEHGDS
jgi:hypothetical protein